jgi:cytoskeleton protein RodZ
MEQREAASHLGLSLVLIRALEEDAFQQLGAPIFVRAYLSRYAKLLDLPEQEILERYKRLGFNEPPPLRISGSVKSQAKMTDRSVRWFSYLMMVAIVGWLAWLGVQQFSSRLETPRPATPTSQGISPAPATAPQPPLPSPAESQPSSSISGLPQVISEPPQTTPEPPKITTPAPLIPPTPPTAVISPPETPVSTPAQESQTTPAQASIAATEPSKPVTIAGIPELVLAFTQDCWVDIKDANGNRLAYGIMKAETVSTLSGPTPFSLLLGNSGGVQIKLNGQAIDPATYVKRGGVSRFVLQVSKPGE